MNLVRWQPLREMVGFNDMIDRLFDDRFSLPLNTTHIFGEGLYPLVDMYQTDTSVVVKATIPGANPEDIDISVTDGTLIIKGKTTSEEEVKEDNYYYRERRHGTFTRSLVLPTSVETTKAEANFENGVLTLTIPKAEEVKPKQIKIKSKEIGEKKE